MAEINVDYAGADVSWNTQTTHGRHHNIGTFIINTGQTVTVTDSIGSVSGDTFEGSLVIEADTIVIDGDIIATGAGYLGGSGGSGGQGGVKRRGYNGSGGSSGVGLYAGSGGGGGSGGDLWVNASDNPHGRGGNSGSSGKYCNGVTSICDVSTDTSLFKGCGGGGAGGGGGGGGDLDGSCKEGGPGGGGGAGGRGGGKIKLTATGFLTVNGKLYTKGTLDGGNGGNGSGNSCNNGGSGGSGGNASSTASSAGGSGRSASEGRGGNGGTGGAGSGGGILLYGYNIIINPGAILDTRDGTNSATYGGKLKIFYVDSFTNDGTTYTGSFYTFRNPPKEFDIGLRVFNGVEVDKIPVAQVTDSRLSSPLHIEKNGEVYQVLFTQEGQLDSTRIKVEHNGVLNTVKKILN